MNMLRHLQPFKGLGMAGLGIGLLAASMLLRNCAHDLKDQGAAEANARIEADNQATREKRKR